jgi:hypothetical protein
MSWNKGITLYARHNGKFIKATREEVREAGRQETYKEISEREVAINKAIAELYERLKGVHAKEVVV